MKRSISFSLIKIRTRKGLTIIKKPLNQVYMIDYNRYVKSIYRIEMKLHSALKANAVSQLVMGIFTGLTKDKLNPVKHFGKTSFL